MTSLQQLLESSPGLNLHDGQAWGNWHLNLNNLTLQWLHPDTGAWAYEIDLERCSTGSAICDWIFQVPETYRSGQDGSDLIMALDAILHPQAFFCSGGRNYTAAVRDVIRYNQWPQKEPPTKVNLLMAARLLKMKRK